MKTSSLFLSSLVAAAAMSSVPAFADGLTVDGSNVTVSENTTYDFIRVKSNDLNISAIVDVTGTAQSVVSSEATFFLRDSGGTSTTTISSGGVLNLADAKVSNRDGTGCVVIDGGEANFGQGLNVLTNWGSVNVTMNSGSLNIGEGGIAFTKYAAGSLTVTLNGGTVGSLADSWSTTQAITLGGDVAFDTTKKQINTGAAASSAGTASTITLGGNVTQTAGTLAVSGTGTLNLSGATTLDGAVSVSGGSLKISGTSTLNGAVSVSGGTLNLSGTSTLSGSVTVDSGATLDLSGGTLTLASAISNSGTVTVNSSTVFVLNDSLKNTDSGVYTLISGTGSIDGWNNVSLSSLRQADGTAFGGRVTANLDTAGAVTITGAAYNLFWKGGTSGTWNTTDATVWGKDSASGADTAFVTGDNVTFDTNGNVAVTVSSGIKAGTVTVASGTTLALTNQQNLTADYIVVANGATLDLGSSGSAVSKNVSGAGTVKFISTATGHGGKLTLDSGFTGTIDYTGKFNTSNGVDNPGAKFRLSGGSMWGSNTISNDIHFVTDYQIGDTTLSNNILNGKVTNEAGTTLTIGGNNTTVTFGGTATFGNLKQTSGTLNFSGTGTIDTFTQTGGTLNQTAGTLTFAGSGESTVKTFTQTAGTLTVNEGATLNISGSSSISGMYSGAGTLNVNDGATLEMEGNSSDANQVKGTVTVKGGGTLKFSGHDLTGWYTSSDTVAVLTGDSTEKLARLDVNDTGSLTFTHVVAMNGNALISTSRSEGSSITSLGGKIIATGTNNTISDIGIQARKNFEIEVSGKEDELKISSTIENNYWAAGTIVKTGLGALTLSGTSTFTGGVNINAGTLIAGSASALGKGKTTVAADAKLGLIAGTTVEVSGGITLTEGAKIVIDMAGGSSAETFVLDLITGTSLTYGTTSITSDNVDSTLKNVIEFSNWGDESLNDWTQKLTFNESSKTLSLSLTKIPEPSAFGLLAGVGALVFVAARRRRRAK